MKLTETKLAGVVILEPDVFGDHRGFFMESWSKRKLDEMGLSYDFVQDNHSSSTVKGTLRISSVVTRRRLNWCAARVERYTMWRSTCGPPAQRINSGLG